jgi:outer membrane immunogenic protein
MVAWRGLGIGSAVAVLATFGLAGSALADGGPGRGGKIQECCIDWGGLYLGAHVGYQWSDSDWVFDAFGTRTSSEQDGAIAGLQIGLQHQMGNVVIGIEAGLSSSLNPWNYSDSGLCPAANFYCQHRVDNILSAGVRLGWALQRAMPYVTAGYAGAAVSSRTVFNQPATLVGQTFDKGRERHDGWYIGGGVDWAVHCCDSSWTIGIEYRHYEFEDTTHVPATVGGVLVVADRRTLDTTADSVTLRLNYKIGRPAQTLK